MGGTAVPGAVVGLSLIHSYMELNKILIRLCEYTREKNEASDLIRRAVQYIQKHYSDEALSITQIAEQLSLSPSWLLYTSRCV